MSEYETPPVSDGTVQPASEALSPEAIDEILGEFRTWLEQMAVPAEEPAAAREAGHEGRIDLHTLLAEFTALRHDINLQTRSSRKQQEHNEATLQQLSQALVTLQRQHEALEEQAQLASEETIRPLLKTLVGVHDALDLARREVRRVDDVLLPALAELESLAQPREPAAAEVQTPEYSFWSRLFGRGKTTVPEVSAQERIPDLSSRIKESVERVRQLVTSIVTGYSMSVQRIDRTLAQHDLEPIPAVGEPFDPELMEAVEVVVEPGRSTTEVVEEVRRGYLWKGQIFRFAQVKVAKPDPRENNHE